VQRLPSGKLPLNFQYAGKVFGGSTSSDWPTSALSRYPNLPAKYPDGVRFTPDGFPDFSPYAMHVVDFDPNFLGNHGSDFAEANRKAGVPRTPDGYTWHHHQDTRTMLCIPKDIHWAVKHAGGVAIMKGRNPSP
jgi:hypothetical protein